MNTFSVRQKQIFQLLLNSKDFISSKEISAKLDVSVRTIKSDVLVIKDKLNHSDIECVFISSPSKGYKIECKQPQLIKEYLSDTYFFGQNKYLEDDMRQMDIFLDILNSTKIVTVKYLTEKYFISRATLYHDLKIIAKDLKEFNVILDYQPYFGIQISGSEIDIRFALQNKLLINSVLLAEKNYIFNCCRFTKENLLNFINSLSINKISDFELSNLYYHLLTLLMRCQNEQYLKEDKLSYKMFVNELEIQKTFDYFYKYKVGILTIPRSEIIYFVLLLKGCNLGFCNQFALDVTVQSLQKLSDKLKIIFNEDSRINDLSKYIYSLLIRNYNHFKQNSLMINDIKIKHPLSFDIAYYYVEIIENMLNIQIDNSEVYYLSYYFLKIREALRKYYLPNKILVTSVRGTTMSQFLLSELSTNFSFYVFEICELYELKNKVESGEYSFVISDVAIHLENEIPIILISHFLDSNDFKIIRKHLRLLLRGLIDDYFIYMKEISEITKYDFFKLISDSDETFNNLITRENRFTYQVENTAIVYLYNSYSKTGVYFVKNGVEWDTSKVNYILVINVIELNKLLNYTKIINIYLKRIKEIYKVGKIG